MLAKRRHRLIEDLEEESTENINNVDAFIRRKTRRALITAINNVLEFVPFVTIPFLAIFDNSTLFLAVHTFILGFRLWWVWRYLRSFEINLLEKIFLVLNLTVWIVHHGVYLVFWTIEKVAELNRWTNYSA